MLVLDGFLKVVEPQEELLVLLLPLYLQLVESVENALLERVELVPVEPNLLVHQRADPLLPFYLEEIELLVLRLVDPLLNVVGVLEELLFHQPLQLALVVEQGLAVLRSNWHLILELLSVLDELLLVLLQQSFLHFLALALIVFDFLVPVLVELLDLLLKGSLDVASLALVRSLQRFFLLAVQDLLELGELCV